MQDAVSDTFSFVFIIFITYLVIAGGLQSDLAVWVEGEPQTGQRHLSTAYKNLHWLPAFVYNLASSS